MPTRVQLQHRDGQPVALLDDPAYAGPVQRICSSGGGADLAWHRDPRGGGQRARRGAVSRCRTWCHLCRCGHDRGRHVLVQRDRKRGDLRAGMRTGLRRSVQRRIRAHRIRAGNLRGVGDRRRVAHGADELRADADARAGREPARDHSRRRASERSGRVRGGRPWIGRRHRQRRDTTGTNPGERGGVGARRERPRSQDRDQESRLAARNAHAATAHAPSGSRGAPASGISAPQGTERCWRDEAAAPALPTAQTRNGMDHRGHAALDRPPRSRSDSTRAAPIGRPSVQSATARRDRC